MAAPFVESESGDYVARPPDHNPYRLFVDESVGLPPVSPSWVDSSTSAAATELGPGWSRFAQGFHGRLGL